MYASINLTCECAVCPDITAGHELIGEQGFPDLRGPEHEDSEPGRAEATVSGRARIVVLRARTEARPTGVGVAQAAGSKRKYTVKLSRLLGEPRA